MTFFKPYIVNESPPTMDDDERGFADIVRDHFGTELKEALGYNYSTSNLYSINKRMVINMMKANIPASAVPKSVWEGQKSIMSSPLVEDSEVVKHLIIYYFEPHVVGTDIGFLVTNTQINKLRYITNPPNLPKVSRISGHIEEIFVQTVCVPDETLTDQIQRDPYTGQPIVASIPVKQVHAISVLLAGYKATQLKAALELAAINATSEGGPLILPQRGSDTKRGSSVVASKKDVEKSFFGKALTYFGWKSPTADKLNPILNGTNVITTSAAFTLAPDSDVSMQEDDEGGANFNPAAGFVSDPNNNTIPDDMDD